jgi:hypothetical protein
MRALTTAEMLDVWERGQGQPPLHQSLMLLSVATAEPVEAIAQLSVGQRDAHLLRLREWAFGSDVVAMVNCPRCGERLELNFRTSDIRVEDEAGSRDLRTLEIDGYKLCCRTPNSLDLIAIAGLRDPVFARQQLLKRCLSEISHEGILVTTEQLPPEILSAVVEHMAEADPQADVQIALTCSDCKHHWQASFDIGSFFCREIHAWAQRTLREVHLLASAYGWREIDILMISPLRRQFYLSCSGGL